MTVAINTNSFINMSTGCTRMGYMGAECEEGNLVGVFVIPKLCFKVLHD